MAAAFAFSPLTPPSSAKHLPVPTPAPAPTPIWDAYATLQVTGRHSMGMSCIGHKGGYNSGRPRCKWDIPHDKYQRLRGLIDYIELQSPQHAGPYLRDIASLSLCQDYHQNQSYDFQRGWQDLIQHARMLSSQEVDRIVREKEMLRQKSSRFGSGMGDPFTDSRLVDAATEIEDLKRKLRASEETAQIAQGQFAQLEDLKVQMRQHFDTEKTETLKRMEVIRELEGLNSGLNKEVQDLVDRLADEAKRMKILEEEVRQAKANGQAYFDAAATLRSQLEEEWAVSQNLRVELEHANGATTMLSVDFSELQAGLDDLKMEKYNLDEENRTLKSALALKIEKLEEERTVSQNLRVKLENSNGATTMLSGEFSKLREEVNDLKTEKIAIDEANQTLKAALALKTKELEQERAVCQNLQVDLKNADGATTMLSVDFSELREEVNDLKTKKIAVDEANQTLKATLASKTEELELLRDHLRSATTATNTFSTIQQQLKDSHLEQENTRRELEDVRAANLQMQEELQRTRLELSNAHMEYHQAQTSAMQEELAVVRERFEGARHRPVRFLFSCVREKIRK